MRQQPSDIHDPSKKWHVQFLNMRSHTLATTYSTSSIYTWHHTFQSSQTRKTKSTYRDSTDATRLCADHTTHRAHASIDIIIKDELGDLSGLSAPCFSTHHQDTVRVDQLHKFLRTERWTGMRGRRVEGYKMRREEDNMISNSKKESLVLTETVWFIRQRLFAFYECEI